MSDTSSDRSRDAVDAAGLGTWDFHPQTGTLWWSERCKALFGLPAAASVDYGVFLRGVHIDDRARVSQAVQRALTPGADPHLDLEYRVDPGHATASAGGERWLRARGEAHFDEAGVPARLVGVVIEVSDGKQQALHDRWPGQIAESSADLIAFVALDGRALYMNPAGLKLVGLADLAALAGHAMADLLVPEDQQRLRSEALPAVQQVSRWVGELRLRHLQSGRVVPVHYQLFRVDDPATGELAGYATLAVDLTGRRSGGEGRFLADSVPQLLSTLNARGDITYVNRRAREFAGHAQEGPGLRDPAVLHPDDLAAAEAAWASALATGHGYRSASRVRRKDGEYRWLQTDVTPQYDAEGRVLQWVRASTDIHEFKQGMEDQRARAHSELERRLAAAQRRIAELELERG